MGAGASKSPIDITAKTLDARRITQEIFRFMITQMKFEEFLSLASPDQCKKYVILISDSLQKFFTKIRILPDKTKDGYIYFRKFDDVKGATPLSQQYCLVIAIFFVRIFQIYGALALSIIDTNTSVYDITFGGGLDELEALEETKPVIQRGGALPYIAEEPLLATNQLQGVFNELRPYLARMAGKNDWWKMKGYHIFINMTPYEKGGTKYLIRYQYVRSVRSGSENIGFVEADMKIEKKERTLNVYFQNIRIKGIKYKIEDSHFSFRRNENVFGGSWISAGKEIPARFHAQFESIINLAEDDYDDDDEDRRETREGKPGVRKEDYEATDRKVREQFKTFRLMERLKKIDTQPVKAHCIARALQLVSGRGLQKEFPTALVSSACESKFFSEKDKRFPESLPSMEGRITDERGIYTLWQLFFDKVLPDMSPDMSDSTREKYKIASAFLSKAFQNPAPQPIKDITSKTGSAFCAGKKDKQIVIRDKGTIQNLRAVTGKMLEVQLNHTAKAMVILKKLFVIQPGKAITIHPTVLEGGIPVVNQIAEETRNLLVGYYTSCEALYGKGVETIEKGKFETRTGFL
jgi:hypothetical protein